ncbi:MAG: transcriptional regulator [Planctomycetes bacterium]|nr:transcriptional regulator [Planctomycetota bacterium]
MSRRSPVHHSAVARPGRSKGRLAPAPRAASAALPGTNDFGALARRLGDRIRAARTARSQTLAQFAEVAKLSRRFLTDVELGKANVSLQGLARIATALELPLATLLETPVDGSSSMREALLTLARQLPDHALRDGAAQLASLRTRRAPLARFALIGLRGAGKSSLGRAVASRCGLAFVELDQEVEAAAGMPLADLFTLHGETYYRQLERQALQRLVDSDRGLIVATGGGIVAAPETFDLLRRSFTVIWLKASPEEHWNRVVAQGDHRPMQGQPAAMARLREILGERAPLYGLAHHTVDTSTMGAAASERAIEALVRAATRQGGSK